LKSEMKSQGETTIVKKYVQGDEAKIVELLNLCFGEWGNLEKWRYRYPQYPTFTNEDVVTAECGGKIVGHGGIHVRDLIVKNGCKVLAALLGDIAVHPDFRRKGIWTKLLEVRLESAKSRGVSLAFCWVLRGSITHETNIKRGFIEVKRPPSYIKMLRPEKILANRLTDLLYTNQKFMNALRKFGMEVSFCRGKGEIYSRVLLNEPVKKEGWLRIILSEEALPSIIHFRRISRLRRAATLVFLVIFRKIKVKSSSMSIFLKLIINGIGAMWVL